MAQERLSVRKIREVLRLKHEVGLSNRAIARACQVSNSTVGEYLKRAEQARLSWPLPNELGEEELYAKLFPEGEKPKGTERPLPDWEQVHRELARKGVTLKLLWHIVPMSFGRNTGKSIQMDMDGASFVSTMGVGTESEPLACECHTRVEMCWRWTIRG